MFSFIQIFYLFWCIFILNFLIATGPDAEYILRNRQRLHKYLSSFTVADIVLRFHLQSGINRRMGLETAAPAHSMCEIIWTLCIPLWSMHAQQIGKRTRLICCISFFRRTWSEQQSGVSRAGGQQRVGRPLALAVHGSSGPCSARCIRMAPSCERLPQPHTT